MKSVLNYIKVKSVYFQIAGGVLFIVALILGVFWIILSDNSKMEPLIFIIGGLSTILCSLPSIANLFQPDRKLVRDMSSDEIIEFILMTSKQDWQGNQTVEVDEYFLIEDPRLRIVTHDPEDIGNLNFYEPWLNQLMDANAWSCFYRILYDGHLIKRTILVYVDGNRVLLPLPNLQDMSVKKLEYKIAQIYNNQNILDNYMNRLRLQVLP